MPGAKGASNNHRTSGAGRPVPEPYPEGRKMETWLAILLLAIVGGMFLGDVIGGWVALAAVARLLRDVQEMKLAREQTHEATQGRFAGINLELEGLRQAHEALAGRVAHMQALAESDQLRHREGR